MLGIRREETYVGAPGSDTRIRPGDTVVLYGREDRLRELSERGAGDVTAREDAIADHEAVRETEDELLGR